MPADHCHRSVSGVTTVEPQDSKTRSEPGEDRRPIGQPLLAGEPDDDNAEPHIWRGVD
jgi:hypothetical protein